MITRTHRFHGHGSLRFVYARGQMLRGQYGSIKYILNTRNKTYRVAVVVSRKVHKSAVVRNRIRRRIYEIIRSEAENITEPYDIVIIAYSDVLADMDQADLRERVIGKLKKAHIIQAKPASKPSGHAIVN